MFNDLHEHFKVPQVLKPKAMCFDINDDCLLYGEIVEIRGVKHFIKYGKEILEKGIIKDGLLLEQKKLENVFINLKKKLKFSFIKISTSVLDQEEISKYLSIFNNIRVIPVVFLDKRESLLNALINKDEDKRILVLDIDKSNNISLILSYFGSVYYVGKIKNNFQNLLENINDLFIEWNIKNSKNIKLESLDYVILNSVNNIDIESIPLFEKILKLRIFKSNSWINVYDIEKHVPDLPYEDSVLYANVIGLGVFEGNTFLNKKIKNKINFDNKIRLWAAVFKVSTFVFIIATLTLIPTYLISGLKIEIAENSFNKIIDNSNGLDSASISSIISDINSKIDIIKSSTDGVSLYQSIFNIILNNTNINYKEISTIKENDLIDVNIKGIAKNRESLDKFIKKIDENIENPDFNYDNNLKENINFTLNFKIKNE
jgi:hypothetical protein